MLAECLNLKFPGSRKSCRISAGFIVELLKDFQIELFHSQVVGNELHEFHCWPNQQNSKQIHLEQFILDNEDLHLDCQVETTLVQTQTEHHPSINSD